MDSFHKKLDQNEKEESHESFLCKRGVRRGVCNMGEVVRGGIKRDILIFINHAKVVRWHDSILILA